MNNAKNIYGNFLTLLLFVLGTVVGNPAMAQKKPVILRLVEPAPANDWPLAYKDMEFAKRFNERAKGEYKMEVFAGGALAKLPEYFDAVRVGAVEMADAPWGMFGFAEPRLSLLEMPFMFDSMGAASYACRSFVRLYDPILQKKFNAKGLALTNTGGLQLWSSRPVKTLEDMKGLMVGAISPPSAKLIKDLGGSAVPIMWTDMYEALQKKVIDAAIQGTHGMVVTQLFRVVKNGTIFFGIAGYNGYTINLDVWNKMPQHIKDLLQEEADNAADWMTKVCTTKIGDDDMKVYKENGLSIYILPKAEREKWAKRLAPYRDGELAKSGEFGQKIMKIAEDANQRFPYTERGMY
jgi:TRAP-type C4-dicarboxylate transport system substrate-binding protein